MWFSRPFCKAAFRTLGFWTRLPTGGAGKSGRSRPAHTVDLGKFPAEDSEDPSIRRSTSRSIWPNGLQ